MASGFQNPGDADTPRCSDWHTARHEVPLGRVLWRSTWLSLILLQARHHLLGREQRVLAPQLAGTCPAAELSRLAHPGVRRRLYVLQAGWIADLGRAVGTVAPRWSAWLRSSSACSAAQERAAAGAITATGPAPRRALAAPLARGLPPAQAAGEEHAVGGVALEAHGRQRQVRSVLLWKERELTACEQAVVIGEVPCSSQGKWCGIVYQGLGSLCSQLHGTAACPAPPPHK
mmetsp:Transcript_121222/g.354343  ORF Transcript_121222/g.354343 Transcript_121222/m.354343 type:complete len:231 (-) Transcript_121222:20-712(-)